MFGEIKLPTFKIELLLPGHIARAEYEPKGDLVIFLNDPRYSVLSCTDVVYVPIMPDAQVRGTKQPVMALNKSFVNVISVLEEDKVEKVNLLVTKRPIHLYTMWYFIQGQLHVNADARDDDLFDETKQFFGMSNVTIAPIRSVRKAPTRQVPLIAINRQAIVAYHPAQPE